MAARSIPVQPAWPNGQVELRKEYQRSSETFAKHYRRQYPKLDMPPVWVSSELILQSPGHDWRRMPDALIADHPEVPPDFVGLPAGWQQAALWSAHACNVTKKAAITHPAQQN